MKAMFSFLVMVIIAALHAREARAQEIPPGDVPMRVWDVIVREGRPYVLQIRTCQPRGLSQGEVVLRRPGRPLSSPRRSHVFSNEGDVELDIVRPENSFLEDPTALSILFVSPSASVNTRHGPLLAHLMAPEEDLHVGDTFEILVDPGATRIYDDEEAEASFHPMPGTLTVCDNAAPFVLGVEPVETTSGGWVRIAVGSYELLPLRRLDFALVYDPEFLPHAGNIDFWDLLGDFEAEVDHVPGRLEIGIQSPSETVNLLPGPIVEIIFHISGTLEVGDSTVLSLDPDATVAVDRSGQELDLDLRAGTFTVLSRQEDGG